MHTLAFQKEEVILPRFKPIQSICRYYGREDHFKLTTYIIIQENRACTYLGTRNTLSQMMEMGILDHICLMTLQGSE